MITASGAWVPILQVGNIRFARPPEDGYNAQIIEFGSYQTTGTISAQCIDNLRHCRAVANYEQYFAKVI